MFDALRTLPWSAADQPLFDGSNYTLLKLVYRLRLQTIALKHTHKNERMPSRQAQQQRLCMVCLQKSL